MALAYLDTSALAKRYVQEAGSAWVTALCEREPVATSILALPELASALARRAHEGAFSTRQRDLLFQAFLRDLPALVLIDLPPPIVQQAATLLLSTPPSIRLRTLDALHIASARTAFARARRRGIATGSFIAADRNLITAATWAGLSAQNPEDYP